MNSKKHSVFIGLFLLTILPFCKKPEPPVPVEYLKSEGVFVCNEGNYGYGNASLSFYDPENASIENQIFYNTNNFPLGDVCMSMAVRDTLGYLVVNNSGKIFVINTNTFKYIAAITGFISPRYMLFINDTKAYVSDLYGKNISIVNPKTFEMTGSVSIGNSTEALAKYGDYVFATSWSYNNKVYQIDTRTDKLIDSLNVAKQPNSIFLDKNNKLWILSDGGFPGMPGGTETAALTKINAETFTIEKIYTFDSPDVSPKHLCLNGTGDTLYFINGTWSAKANSAFGIYRMAINNASLPSEAFIPQNGKLFYGLGIDPITSDIYVSDAVDYQQKGIVYRFKPDGTPIDSFKTDIIPSYFCFKK